MHIEVEHNGWYYADDIFKSIFLINWKYIDSHFTQVKFVPEGPIDNMWPLFLVMAWHWIGNKPSLDEWCPKMCDSIMVSQGHNELTHWPLGDLNVILEM